MKRLFISALIILVAVATASAADYNIKRYGAVSDTTKYSTKALQKAIDACSKAGGGRYTIATFANSTLDLDSIKVDAPNNVTVYLSDDKKSLKARVL